MYQGKNNLLFSITVNVEIIFVNMTLKNIVSHAIYMTPNKEVQVKQVLDILVAL